MLEKCLVTGIPCNCIGDCMAQQSSQFNKADGGKSNPLLLEKHMVRALASVNAVLDYGAQKYEPEGWRKVEPERYDKAARRHRKDRDYGETHDKESGLLHLSHEVCNLLFQIEMFIDANPGVNYLAYKAPPTEHRNK